MKKLLLGVAIAISSLSFAQKFGVKANLNISDVTNSQQITKTKMKVGFSGGVFANVPINDKYSIQPEIIYNQLGAETDIYNFGGILGNMTTTTKLDYISVPVMIQYNLPSNIFVEAGPEFSYLVDAKQTLNSILTSSTAINKDYLNRFNLGIGAGLGYNLSENLALNARYTFGLTNIGKDGSLASAVFNQSKNNNIQVGLGFKF